MPNFIRQITVAGQLFDFSFFRIQTMKGPKYFVMVADSSREYHFIIEKILGEWMINDAPKVPQWIHDQERQLVQAISENEKRSALNEE